MMKYFLFAAIIPLALTLVIAFTKLTATEVSTYRNLEWLSLLGFVLTYLGFLFSLFAALKVKELSERHFTKTMLPSLTSQINEIVTYMSASAGTRINQIDIDRKLHKIPAILVSIEGAKGHNAGSTITEARVKYEELRRWMDVNRQSTVAIGDSTAYWPLLSKMSEMGEFILAFIEQEKAR